jgi:hypothetical protein
MSSGRKYTVSMPNVQGDDDIDVAIQEAIEELLSNNVNFTGLIGVNQTNPLAPIHVGNGNVNNSTDAQILVSRLVDDSTPGLNGHAFSDSSTIDCSGGESYNSFDARIIIIGDNDYGHFSGFQTGILNQCEGNIGDIYSFNALLVTNDGIINNAYGFYVFESSGLGELKKNYGLFVESLEFGTEENWAVYTEGKTESYFGGNVRVGADQFNFDTEFIIGNDISIANTSALRQEARSNSSQPMFIRWLLNNDANYGLSSHLVNNMIVVDTTNGETSFVSDIKLQTNKGIVLKSPSGTSYRVTVSDAGVLIVT